MNHKIVSGEEKYCAYHLHVVFVFLQFLFITTATAAESHICAKNKLPSGSLATGVLATNSHRFSASTLLFKIQSNRDNWQGELSALSVNLHDRDGEAQLSTVWNASDIDPAKRHLFTINQLLESDHKGIRLEWEVLSHSQKKLLQGEDNLDLAKKRLAWLKGNDSENLRSRSHLLSDIIHSNLSFLGQLQNYGHTSLQSVAGKAYNAFLKTKATRNEIVFVGANDGMLHAFDGEDGAELFAYIPNEIFSKISTISHPNYGCEETNCLAHEYLVDGKTSLGDAYFNGTWHSVLIGTLGLGGKGIYALDVSDPINFSAKNVLWEVSSTHAPINVEVYERHMGTIAQEASIVRLKNGKWVAIIGNGYQSQSNQAVLFIIDIETGTLIKALNTQTGSASLPNGLSTPISIDSDSDNVVDTIYAGDLLGNLWRFDVSSVDESQWGLSFENKPLFRACEDNTCKKPQAITAKPQVGNHPEGGLMVYFGTGQNIFQTEDVLNSFYALRDRNMSPITSRQGLVKQEILQENSVGTSLEMRITSNKSVDYAENQGWLLNLGKSFSQLDGEKITTQPILKEGKLIISSEIPLKDNCSAYESRWMMKLDALQGNRLEKISFDTNKDNKMTQDDNTDYKGISTIVSGVQLESTGLSARKPVILDKDKQSSSVYTMGEGTSIKSLKTSKINSSGRVSWRHLH